MEIGISMLKNKQSLTDNNICMVRKILIVLCAMLVCTFDVANAQSKPKRDVSKDKSVIAAQRKVQTKKTTPKQQTQAKKIRKAYVTPPQTKKQATYLRVNQLTSVSKNVSSQAGSETFTVNTDGKEWSVVALPFWCNVTRYSDRFVLSYNSNPSYDTRSDWFKVKCDNQEVRIDIKQEGAPVNITSNFNYAYLQHNTDWSGDWSLAVRKTKWLGINANVTIKGAKGLKCLVVAFVADEYGKNIKAASSFPSYGLPSSNDVYAATEVIPQSDDAQTFYVNLRLPNNAMRLLKKKNKLRCYLAVYCTKTSTYVSGANYTLRFNAKSKKGKVTTKKQ